MKLYLLSQDTVSGYDTYDSCIVAAKNEEDARTIYPNDYADYIEDGKWMGRRTDGSTYSVYNSAWVEPSDLDKVNVEYLGTAKPGTKRGVILASFNAG